MEDLSDWLATALLILAIGIGMGYVWRYVQEPIHYKYEEVEAIIDELLVVTRGEVCP